MQMPKPTEADKDRFRSLVPDDPRIEVKPMFGNLGAFVNGNMFAGLFGPDIGVKLDAVSNLDLAPTIARLLNLQMPDVQGRVLTEILSTTVSAPEAKAKTPPR